MSSRKNIENLCSRWSQEDLTKIQRLLLAGRIEEAGLAKVRGDGEDYLDLRGLILEQFVKGIQIDHIDFSFLSTAKAGQFGFSTLDCCLFVAADFHSNLGNRFIRCDFSRAKLQRSVLRGSFEQCIFVNANLSSVLANTCRFVECSFVQTNLKQANFYDCAFDRCDFTDCKFGGGSLAGSRFITSRPTESELGDTFLERVVFETTSTLEES